MPKAGAGADRADHVRRLVAEGLSAGQAAKALSVIEGRPVSRNTIIGIVFRANQRAARDGVAPIVWARSTANAAPVPAEPLPLPPMPAPLPPMPAPPPPPPPPPPQPMTAMRSRPKSGRRPATAEGAAGRARVIAAGDRPGEEAGPVATGCRWIYGDIRKGGWCWCNRPQVVIAGERSPWCLGHRTRAYREHSPDTRSADRRRQRA